MVVGQVTVNYFFCIERMIEYLTLGAVKWIINVLTNFSVLIQILESYLCLRAKYFDQIMNGTLRIRRDTIG